MCPKVGGKWLWQWCEYINQAQSDVTYDFGYVDQENFEKYKPGSFRELIHSFREYKDNRETTR